MVNIPARKRTRAITRFIGLAVLLTVLNGAAQSFLFRIDLTGDRRYTLADASKRVMQQLDNTVQVYVFLDGPMSLQLKKLRSTIKETLDELKVYAGARLRYEFVDISADAGARELPQVYASLQARGLFPVTEEERTAGGGRSERTVFPGALVVYTHTADTAVRTREIAVNFLQDNSGANSDESLLAARQNVEPALTGAIARIARTALPRIAFIEGHGELDEYETGDICRALSPFTLLDRVEINEDLHALDPYTAVVIAKPSAAWSDADKLALDQYIMHGGRVAWFIDAVEVHHDSLANGFNTLAFACAHGLDDQLFRYGVRINPVIIQDLQCAMLPVNIAPAGQTADFKPAPWTYYPLLIPPPDNAITRGLNLILSKYPGTVDTVGKNPAVARKHLLYSSEYSRTQAVPALVSLSQTMQRPDPAAFRQPFLPVAVTLEGSFTSAFLNRPLQYYNRQKPFDFKETGEPSKMIVVADGDIIRNDVVRRPDGTRIFPLGFDRYMNVQFGNGSFVKNCIYYLLDDENTMQIRPREWQMRLLDKGEITQRRTRWTILNTLLPIALALLPGGAFLYFRKRRYATRK
ncbi:MAG: gliding motility-associated ABC transporter substrate-binding protein GldG [Prevotellaceae bacterium]|jgi:ABC-2 type transport system permease protein|nr:gliding motility-associated ABC transporter substrate-binding protein GldG [Prevotellaceae bacterium]